MSRVSNYRNKLRTVRARRAAVGIVAVHDLGSRQSIGGHGTEYVTVVELSSGQSVRSVYLHRDEILLDQLNVARLRKLAEDLRVKAGVPLRVLEDFVDAANREVGLPPVARGLQ